MLPDRVDLRGARGRLLTAATELFAARGYHGVSVRDITSHMGVQPSSLYAQFKSKTDLFGELAYVANEEIRDRLRDAVVRANGGPLDQMRGIVSSYVTFHTEFPLLATIGHNDLHVLSGEQLHRVTSVRKEGIDLMLAVIAHGNEQDVFHCGEPWLAVAAIAGMGIRVASWYRPADPASAPDDGYTTVVHQWMPRDFTIADVTETFTRYALAILTRER